MKIQFQAYVKNTISLPMDKFPRLLTMHLTKVKRTKEIELQGALLVRNNFKDWESTKNFIMSVCRWGNYPGIYGRVLKNNRHTDIIDKFRNVKNILNSREPNLKEALDLVCHINSLSVSFASKHLRFLFPKLCPVLDNLLADYLDYELTSKDYLKFSKFCYDVSKKLSTNNIKNPFPGRKLWYSCDV